MLIFRTFIQTINSFAFFVIKGIARKQESKDNKTIKITDFVITKEIAMEYMKTRHPGYHMRPSRWKDIKISVHI